MSVEVHHGDCLTILPTLPDASIDAVVTDPPYGLGFMGKAWDDLPPGVDWARECLRVLKPGGHLLAFGGTRTWHRLAVAVEDAGFEIRDSIAWVYGSGFPKSRDVAKAINIEQGVRGEAVPYIAPDGKPRPDTFNNWQQGGRRSTDRELPATAAARTWQGWGTALKPAFEPVVVARKPLSGTVAANVLAHGTGALNIAGCRIGDDLITSSGQAAGDLDKRRHEHGTRPSDYGRRRVEPTTHTGRWPANFVLDEESARVLDEQSGDLSHNPPATWRRSKDEAEAGMNPSSWQLGAKDSGETRTGFGDSGGASRFFYVAKAPTKERPKVNGIAHPTVKPLTLMRWLVRLVTPPGGTVLDPFAGSGTTVEACLLEGFSCVAIEREADYLPHIQHRVTRAREALGLFALQDEEPA